MEYIRFINVPNLLKCENYWYFGWIPELIHFQIKLYFLHFHFIVPYFDTLAVRLIMFTILQKRFRLTVIHSWCWNYSILWMAIFFFVRMLKFLQHLTWIDSRVFYTTCLVSKHASERNCIWNPYRLFWEHFIRQGCL